MCSAIWSCDFNSVKNSPAASFVSFSNHQLAKLFGRPRWRTVSGGSQEYIAKILEDSDNLVVKTSMNLETVQRGKEVLLCVSEMEKKRVLISY